MRGFTQIAFPPWVRTYPKNTSAKLTLYSDHRCGDELRVNVKYQELESSAKFLAIKRCQRTKIGKVIKQYQSSIYKLVHICATRGIPVNDKVIHLNMLSPLRITYPPGGMVQA